MKKALVLQCGGLRGAVLSGVLLGSGLRPGQFDECRAASSGGVAGAFFGSGQNDITGAVWETLAENIFDGWRILQGSRPIDLDLLIHKKCAGLDYGALAASPMRLFVATFCSETTVTEFHDVAAAPSPADVLKATCAYPFFAPSIKIGGRPKYDGGIEYVLPIQHAHRSEARRIVVVLNQLRGMDLEYVSLAERLIAFPFSSATRAAIERRNRHYKEALAFADNPPQDGTAVCVIAPERPLPVTWRDGDRSAVRATFEIGRELGKRHAEALHRFLE